MLVSNTMKKFFLHYLSLKKLATYNAKVLLIRSQREIYNLAAQIFLKNLLDRTLETIQSSLRNRRDRFNDVIPTNLISLTKHA